MIPSASKPWKYPATSTATTRITKNTKNMLGMILLVSCQPLVTGFAPVPTVVSTAASRPLVMAATTSSAEHLVDRFSRIVRGKVNRVVAKWEDPEKVIVQAVADMQNELIQLRASYADAQAALQRSRREQQQLEQAAAAWYDRAQLALRKNKEQLARQALLRRGDYLTKADVLQTTLDGQARMVQQMHEALVALEQKIQQASAQKAQLVARAKTAKTTQQVNAMLNGLTATLGQTSGNSMAAFARMQERVEAMEAAAEASGNLVGISRHTLDSTELEFQLLEAGSQVDQDLEQLKQEMQLSLPTAASSVALPSQSYAETT